MSRAQLLKSAISLIPTHGFTRQALSQSVMALPQPHPEPLHDNAVSALFGNGDEARRTLIKAWMSAGISEMSNVSSPTIPTLLQARLEYNLPVLEYLPEAFALLASPDSALPPLDPIPALKHSFSIADEACRNTGDTSVRTSWYVRRGSLAAIYTASELHQLKSPQTASHFLDTLLGTASTVKKTVDEASLYADYISRSWMGIFRSKGIL